MAPWYLSFQMSGKNKMFCKQKKKKSFRCWSSVRSSSLVLCIWPYCRPLPLLAVCSSSLAGAAPFLQWRVLPTDKDGQPAVFFSSAKAWRVKNPSSCVGSVLLLNSNWFFFNSVKLKCILKPFQMSYSTLYICSHPIKLTIEASCLIIYLFTIYLKKQNSKDICTEIFCLLEFSAQVPLAVRAGPGSSQEPGA